MKYIRTSDQSICARDLSERLARELSAGKRVLWLVPGGSNIPISVEAMNALRKSVPSDTLANLSVTLTDERYGPPGHKDSNWRQLEEAGFDFSGIGAFPGLKGESLEKTAAAFGKTADDLFLKSDIVIAQFGVGADCHIAGVLPGTTGVESADTAVSYSAGPFTRITLSLGALRKADAAYAFVFGESKKAAVSSLRRGGTALSKEPAQIVNVIPESFLYSDQ